MRAEPGPNQCRHQAVPFSLCDTWPCWTWAELASMETGSNGAKEGLCWGAVTTAVPPCHSAPSTAASDAGCERVWSPTCPVPAVQKHIRPSESGAQLPHRAVINSGGNSINLDFVPGVPVPLPPSFVCTLNDSRKDAGSWGPVILQLSSCLEPQVCPPAFRQWLPGCLREFGDLGVRVQCECSHFLFLATFSLCGGSWVCPESLHLPPGLLQGGRSWDLTRGRVISQRLLLYNTASLQCPGGQTGRCPETQGPGTRRCGVNGGASL